jgi:cell pole-organizing protein PopZ
MEDILASIRRILNEEEAPATTQAGSEPPADDDVLVLDESMIVSTADPEPTEPDSDEPEAAAAEPEPELRAPEVQPPLQMVQASASPDQADAFAPPAPTQNLLGAEASAAATTSVGNLVRTLAAGRGTQVYSGGPTLEDIVRAELRPLLKEWLDTNLPPMVERLVRIEIERVAGRAVP